MRRLFTYICALGLASGLAGCHWTGCYHGKCDCDPVWPGPCGTCCPLMSGGGAVLAPAYGTPATSPEAIPAMPKPSAAEATEPAPDKE